jgi:hypothetical protein
MDAGYLTKFKWSLPWLSSYPGWRTRQAFRPKPEAGGTHLMVMVANHFEPSWHKDKLPLSWTEQRKRVDKWALQANRIGRVIRDHDDTPFRHTNFFPAEQSDSLLLEKITEIQSDGVGEVEIHLHHGVQKPDNEENLRRTLIEFRDLLSDEYNLLSKNPVTGKTTYGFVHGNLALANSKNDKCCGVDSEMQILAETGCYADFTLPAVPEESQVAKINAIYQCGHPLHERAPHRSGNDLSIGDNPSLPIIVNGPIVFDWRRRWHGIPKPRVDDGILAANYPLDLHRLNHWRSTNICVQGRPEWVFIKLYCHGFFDHDNSQMIGEQAEIFWEKVLEESARTNEFKLHFVSARETFNIIQAALDEKFGNPDLYRDYCLKAAMEPKQQHRYAMAS